MASWQTKILNPAIFVYSRLFFRPSTPPKVLRKRLAKLVTRTGASLKTRFPKSEFRPVTIAGVPCEWIDASPTDNNPVMLYFHGGGYLMGSIDTYRIHALRFSFRCKVRVLLVDYRLAPEHPFPAAFEDGLAVYRALAKEQNGKPFFVAGDSAGGGLSLAVALAVRDLKETLPLGIVCFSPWTNLAQPEKDHVIRGDHMFSSETIHNWAPYYVGQSDAKDPRMSPAYGDYHGMPPILIQVSEDETLYGNALTIQKKITAVSGPLHFQSWKGLPHVWQVMFPFLPESTEAVKAVKVFLENHLPPA